MTEVSKEEQTLQRLLRLELMGSNNTQYSFNILMSGGCLLYFSTMDGGCRGPVAVRHNIEKGLRAVWGPGSSQFLTRGP